MAKKPTYEELEQRVKELEKEPVERKRIEERLEEREKTLQALLNAPTETAILVDLEGTTLAINEIAAKRVGKNLNELIGLGLFEYLPHDVALSRKAKGDEVVRSGKPVRFQDESAGRFYDNNIYPVFDVEEKVTALAIYARDITETKRTEEALQESEKRYRTLISEMINGFAFHEIIVDNNGKPNDYRFLEVNTAFEEITGLQGVNIVGKTVLEVLPKIEPYWIETYGEVALTGKYIRFENYSQELEKYFEVLAYSPQKGQFATVFTDITERKQVEEALRESEEKYSNLFHFSNDGIFLHDLEGNILDVNQKTLDQFEYTKSEMLPFKIPDFHPPEALEKSQWAFETIIREGFVSFETDFKKKTGEVFSAEVSSSLFEIGDKKVIQGIVRDITERKQAEEEREKLIKELQDALKEIKTLRGILPLCSFCKKVRDDKGYWEQVDVYIYKHLHADISHSFCPDCAKKHYPDLDIHE